MKRIIYLLLLTSSGFITAQTKTLVTQFGEKVIVYPNANNGVEPDAVSGSVRLGGVLIKPTKLTTTVDNTLSIEGLQTGISTDKLVVTDATGVLKTISPVLNVGSMNLVRKTVNYTADATSDNVILADASNGNIVITMPAGVATGRMFTVKRVDSSVNTVTIQFTSEFVDETDTFITVGIKVCYQLIKESGTKWQTLSRF
jgi:hypothetical protein